jgi:hypothetical protein
MLGKPKKTEPKLFYHGISLERRIPKEHPLRRIKQLIDFDFVRSQVAELYGTNGNQSVDPSVVQVRTSINAAVAITAGLAMVL